ncbi:MAG TPA: ROK family protein [Polyangiaceae bacterium]|nr:ROK family protein [Polyangiaceae bacterium]
MRIGVDLGGTKIEAIALDDAGHEVQRERSATPNHDYQEILSAIVQLIERVEAKVGKQGSVGIGTPGSISPHSGLMRNSNTTCLNGKPLLSDLECALGRSIRIANDANCFALSEATDGAAAGAKIVFGVILGTGVGGGVVIDGKIVTGGNGNAGEWGHNPLPWPQPAPAGNESPGPLCYCGRSGCIETFLSGPALSAQAMSEHGLQLGAAQIAQRAAAGDAQCDGLLTRYEDRLARGLATVINVLDPEVIVLGGGLSNIERLYQAVPQRLPRYVFSDRVTTLLRKAQHGDSSGVRGAAWLWPAN